MKNRRGRRDESTVQPGAADLGAHENVGEAADPFVVVLADGTDTSGLDAYADAVMRRGAATGMISAAELDELAARYPHWHTSAAAARAEAERRRLNRATLVGGAATLAFLAAYAATSGALWSTGRWWLTAGTAVMLAVAMAVAGRDLRRRGGRR